MLCSALLLASCSGQQPAKSGSSESPSSEKTKGPSSEASRLARVTIPSGTEIHLTLLETVGSSTSQAGDTFKGKTTDPIVVGDRVAIPTGSTIRGQVTDVVPAKKGLKDKGGALTLSFDKIETPAGFTAPMSASLTTVGKSGKKTAGIIGGSAAGGAILGKILGGSTKDAAVGAVIGGAIGTGIAAGTPGKEIEITSGTHLAITLEQPVNIAIGP
ncbi:MAG TPA: hypothetical protein VFW45_13650 [Candidatus Polarisedimenticolia bacterium]|nr:hypothetical protein [Candidatus Polarisedimenticolia bacterium]